MAYLYSQVGRYLTCVSTFKPSILTNTLFPPLQSTYIIETSGQMNLTVNLFTGSYICDNALPTFTIIATKVGSIIPETLAFLNYTHVSDGIGNITSLPAISNISTANYSI